VPIVIDKRVAPILKSLIRDRTNDSAWRDLSSVIWPIVVSARSYFKISQASEIVHGELLTRLYRHTDFTTFTHGQGFTGYIWAIIRNLRMNDVIEKKAVSLESTHATPSPALSPFEDIVLDELLTAVSGRLLPEEKELVGLLIGKKLTREQLAQELSTSVSGLAVRVSRLKSRIQEILESEQRKK
jgi:DNA-directed RNA polymerase specialized sigma24 family protein